MRRLSPNLIRRAKPIRRLGAWLFQVALLVWFLAYSIGLPMALMALRFPATGKPALVAKEGCQCSLKKKMSGTCCCSRRDTTVEAETTRQTASAPTEDEVDLRSCCSKRQPKAVAKATRKSCCSSKVAVAVVGKSNDAKSSSPASADVHSIRGNHRCGCSSSGDWELNSGSIVALPVEDVELVISTAAAQLFATTPVPLPSLRHEPPVPPPRAC